MDFSLYHYSPEEEQFRAEVRAWVAENLTDDLLLPEVRRDDALPLDAIKAFRRKLADKGWAAPTWPVEWGGGGLTPAQAAIIDDVLLEANAPPWPGMIGKSLIAPAVWVWGTEEQKRRFIPPLIRGDLLPYQMFTEPEAGSDLAALKTRAVRDGDDYVITGQKHFVGNAYEPEWFWLLAVTNPEAPRHQNIGAFFMPANLPGVTVETMDMFITEVKRRVYLDEVRVPAEYLIGGEGNGWAVSQSTLEMEHGGGGGSGEYLMRRVRELIDYARTTERDGRPLSQDPAIRRTLVDTWADAQIVRLFALRNGWMHHAKEPMAHQGSQYMVHQKNLSFTIAQAALEIAGPYSALTDPDTAPYDGIFERRFREAINNSHPAGTVEVHKLIVARRLGLAKPAAQAAPTSSF
ncbi:MAG: acyl-CoA dehydrogenase family protein [Dehalococcoidia bacterium]